MRCGLVGLTWLLESGLWCAQVVKYFGSTDSALSQNVSHDGQFSILQLSLHSLFLWHSTPIYLGSDWFPIVYDLAVLSFKETWPPLASWKAKVNQPNSPSRLRQAGGQNHSSCDILPFETSLISAFSECVFSDVPSVVWVPCILPKQNKTKQKRFLLS